MTSARAQWCALPKKARTYAYRKLAYIADALGGMPDEQCGDVTRRQQEHALRAALAVLQEVARNQQSIRVGGVLLSEARRD